MLVYDPHVGVSRPLHELATLPIIDGDYLPVESPRDGAWFVVYTPSNTSLKIDSLGEVRARVVSDRIKAHQAGQVVLEACHRAMGTVPIDNHVINAREVLEQRFGTAAVYAAETKAKMLGFALNDLASAYTSLWEALTLDGVDVNCVSKLTGHLPLADVFAPPMMEGVHDKYRLKAIFLAGAGGAGKSGVADAMFSGLGLKVISTDMVLEQLMKAASLPLKDIGAHYGKFVRARELAQVGLRQYAQSRLGLIVDGTAWRYDRVAKPARKLRKLGYDIFMLYVDVPLGVALERNAARAAKGGRFVPDSFIETAWRGARKNLGNYVKLFGKKNMHIIQNDTEVDPRDWAKKVAPRLRSIGMKILNRPLKNPVGKVWLKAQMDPATRTLDQPGPSEWPKPKKIEPPSPAELFVAKAPSKKRPKKRRHPVVKGSPFDPPPPGFFDMKFNEVTHHSGGTPVCGDGRLNTPIGLLVAAPVVDSVSLLDRTPGHLIEGGKKDFRVRLQIAREKVDPSHAVASIGKSAKNGKWYGWSHRAFSGFGKGDRFFPKLTYHPDWSMDDQSKWEHAERAKQSKIKTDAEARQSAVNFAKWVS